MKISIKRNFSRVQIQKKKKENWPTIVTRATLYRTGIKSQSNKPKSLRST